MGNADDRVGAVGGGPTIHPRVLVVVGKGEADMGGELDGEEGVRSTGVDQGANAMAEDGGIDVEERGDVNWTGGGGGGGGGRACLRRRCRRWRARRRKGKGWWLGGRV